MLFETEGMITNFEVSLPGQSHQVAAQCVALPCLLSSFCIGTFQGLSMVF